MALIRFNINWDGSKVTIVPDVQRLDPGDEIHLITGTKNGALQILEGSPLLPPGGDKVLMLSLEDSSQPIRFRDPIDLSKPHAVCGTSTGPGNFQSWLPSGGGFPTIPKGS